MCADSDRNRTHIQIIMEHSSEYRSRPVKALRIHEKRNISVESRREAFRVIHPLIHHGSKVNGPESISTVGDKRSTEAPAGN